MQGRCSKQSACCISAGLDRIAVSSCNWQALGSAWGPASVKVEWRSMNENTCMCIHLCTHTCEHVHTHAYICAPTHVNMYTHVHTPERTHRHTHTDTTHTHIKKITRKGRKGTPDTTCRRGEMVHFAQSVTWKQQVADAGGMCLMSACGCRRRQGIREADQLGRVETLKGVDTLCYV